MKTEKLRQTFKKASEEIETLYKNLPLFRKSGYYTDKSIIIKGGLGEGMPIINETEIWFNGESKLYMDHETFCVSWKGDRDFNFCKTAQKPYDLLVCLSLLSLLNHFGSEIFQLSSDGDAEEWQEAVDLYNDVTGKGVSNPFETAEVEA
jgi:hypothetical protein